MEAGTGAGGPEQARGCGPSWVISHGSLEVDWGPGAVREVGLGLVGLGKHEFTDSSLKSGAGEARGHCLSWTITHGAGLAGQARGCN